MIFTPVDDKIFAVEMLDFLEIDDIAVITLGLLVDEGC